MLILTVLGLALALAALVALWGWLCYDGTRGLLNFVCNWWLMGEVARLAGVVLAALVLLGVCERKVTG